jgi:hypothetical protein
MTPDEITRLEARITRLERLMYLVLGVALGSGVLQLSQVVG